MKRSRSAYGMLARGAAACLAGAAWEQPAMTNANPGHTATATHEYAMFGAGCFWCSEAVFQRVEGVVSVVPGYAGGRTENPTYKEVCRGDTGHAEVVRVEFDPRKVRYEDLLDLFWKMHDPTTLNRQGADVGTQYRSVIFYYGEAQRQAAEASKRALEASRKFTSPVVTEVVAAPAFYPAEDYHNDYFSRNPNAPYCRFVIIPKLKKLGMDK